MNKGEKRVFRFLLDPERDAEAITRIAAYAYESGYKDGVAATQAENAKLRELVRDMMVAWWACDNERCPRHDKRCEEGKFCAFDECARDLGIEVVE